ncbi:MAG: hypothetical protein PHV07_02995, partial [Oscillospiraceae bacterium]|nr:hypothetical protein [Oscillospiraceae bacterium]
MKKIFILGLAILIFLSGCKNPITATSSEQPPSFLSDFADTAQTIVSALNDQSSEFTGSDSSESNSHNISDPTSQTNSSDNHNETSTSTNSSATDGATTGDFEYHNARTESIYPRRVHFTPIKTYEKRYYKNLDVKTQEVYRIIDNAVYQMQTGYIDLGRCTYAQVVLAYDSVRHDRPEYYWMP